MTSIADTSTMRSETEKKQLQAQKSRKEEENKLLRAKVYENEDKNDKLRSELQKMEDSGVFGFNKEDTISRFVAEQRELDKRTKEFKARDKTLGRELKELFNARPGSPDF